MRRGLFLTGHAQQIINITKNMITFDLNEIPSNVTLSRYSRETDILVTPFRTLHKGYNHYVLLAVFVNPALFCPENAQLVYITNVNLLLFLH
jgi:hypothetical protein